MTRISTLIPVLDAEIGQDLSDSEQHTAVALLQRMASTLELSPGIHQHLSAPSRPDRPLTRARPPGPV